MPSGGLRCRRFAGAGRRVYPGFMQLTALMAMNKERHLNAFKEYYANLADPDEEKLQKAEHTRKFYEDYRTLPNLTAFDTCHGHSPAVAQILQPGSQC